MDHLQGLLDTLSQLVGNLTGHQTHTQATIVAAKHLANLDVQNAAFHRAQTVDKLGDMVIIESITKIQARRIEDWPADGAFEMAPEAEFQLRAINWRRRQSAAKRLNVKHGKDVAGDA